MEKAEELLNIQNNVEGNQDREQSSKLVEYKKIEGSPFTMAKTEDGITLMMGKWQLIDYVETEAEILEYLEFNKWELILKVIVCVKNSDVVKPKMEDMEKEGERRAKEVWDEIERSQRR